MNVSKRDQQLLLILAAAAVFLLLYLLIIAPFNNKKESVQTEINSLSPQLSELQGYQANMASYKTETNKIISSVNNSLSQYPGDVRSEDMVMYATELADKIGINVESIAIDSPVAFSQFSLPQQDGNTYKMVPNAALKVQFTISCDLNYEQMKKLIDYVYKSSKQTGLDSITVSYNSETGILLGTTAISKYFIVSSDYAYSPTKIPSITTGIEDPFGTFTTNKTTATSATDITQ